MEHRSIYERMAKVQLNALIKIIINSPAADVTACLNKNFENESELNNALKKFREDHAPRIIRKPCMHYNYKTLKQAFTLLYDEWSALSANDTNYDKCCLVWRQIIGYLQLTLPAIDRMAFARAFWDNKRSLNYIWADGRFSDVGAGAGLICPGSGRAEYIFGQCYWGAPRCGAGGRDEFQNSCRAKTSNLQSLCSRAELKRPAV